MVKWDRRQFLGGLVATIAQLTTAVAAASQRSRWRPVRATEPQSPATTTEAVRVPLTQTPQTAAEEWEGTHDTLESVLRPGRHFGRWRVVAVHPVKMGAVPIILSTWSGTRFQVDVLRRDGLTQARRGISETRNYALYLANVGRGSTPTPEEHGLGVMWLAALLRTREHRVTSPALLTLRDRLGRFPEGKFDCLRTDLTVSATASSAPAVSSVPAGLTVPARQLPQG